MASTVDRVLPWRRADLTPDEEVAHVVDAFREHHPRASGDLVVRAYRRAAEAHDGQQRKSGDPYISHPVAVAKVTADLVLDDTTIAAALLHDAVEDTRVAMARSARFGTRELDWVSDSPVYYTMPFSATPDRIRISPPTSVSPTASWHATTPRARGTARRSPWRRWPRAGSIRPTSRCSTQRPER